MTFPNIGTAQATAANEAAFVIPDEYRGRYTNLIPGKLGGIVPDTKVFVRCQQRAGCFVDVGSGSAYRLAVDVQPLILNYARESLAYAKAHRDRAVGTHRAYEASSLMPLLRSDSEIASCLDLRLPQPDNILNGSVILCNIKRNPWGKPVVLLMGWTMTEGDPLFSSYFIQPMFRNDAVTQRHADDTTLVASVLSPSQTNYESMALDAKGGLYELEGSLTVTEDWKKTRSINPRGSFYTSVLSLVHSPSISPQSVTTVDESVAVTLTGALRPRINDPVLGYLIDGKIYFPEYPRHARVSYAGKDVLTSYLAQDGRTIVKTVREKGHQRIPLDGEISKSPPELFNNSRFGLLSLNINGNPPYDTEARWKPEAAYMKVWPQTEGDTIAVLDCHGVVILTAESGTGIDPCSSDVQSLEEFFQNGYNMMGTKYADGHIMTLAGLSAWVGNKPIIAADPAYPVYFIYQKKIYKGVLAKHGTPERSFSTNFRATQDFVIYFNSAARASIENAINF